MILVQIAFIAVWIWSYMPALNSLRVWFFRTVCVLGYAWLSSVVEPPQTALTLVCEWFVLIDIISIGLAVWNGDSRLFKHRYGGCQEE
jgi:hypothetical protein